MDEVAELELPTQENVHADLRSIFRGAVKLALETVLDEVVRDMIGARRWQRLASRKDLRNGTYLRKLLTTMGVIEVEVPRTRENGSPVDVLGRYRRRSAELDDGIVAAYVSGASTRDVGGITEALVGERVSRSTVSRVTATLGEKVEQLRKAPITGPTRTSSSTPRSSTPAGPGRSRTSRPWWPTASAWTATASSWR